MGQKTINLTGAKKYSFKIQTVKYVYCTLRIGCIKTPDIVEDNIS